MDSYKENIKSYMKKIKSMDCNDFLKCTMLVIT